MDVPQEVAGQHYTQRFCSAVLLSSSQHASARRIHQGSFYHDDPEDPQVPVPEQVVVAGEATNAPATITAGVAPVASTSVPVPGASASVAESRRPELPAGVLDEEEEDDGYLSDDSDEGIDMQVKGLLSSKTRVMLILLIPHDLAKEVHAAKKLVRALLVFLRKKLLDDALSFQELLSTYLSRTRFSRLQATFALTADAEVVRQHQVDHVGADGKTRYTFGWKHPIDISFLKAKVDMPEGVDVLLKGVLAEITPTIVYESLMVAKLHKRGRLVFLHGAGFHRVMDPVTSLGTDKIRGLVVPHPGDTYRWRHMMEDLLIDKKRQGWSARVLISTESSAEDWLCVQKCCDRVHGETFEQAATHIGSFRHAYAVGAAGVATRAIKAKQSLQAVKRLFRIRAKAVKAK
ncbi:unnamed protein product [Closterium sp. Naga37s-1]|nr:unnamed protein product [Closterium sp. Naga37s-1]